MTLRITELRLKNYRGFESARLPLGDLTFLVGRNGAGKSTLLDALSVFHHRAGTIPRADRSRAPVSLRDHPDRDAQFQHIASQTGAFKTTGKALLG